MHRPNLLRLGPGGLIRRGVDVVPGIQLHFPTDEDVELIRSTSFA